MSKHWRHAIQRDVKEFPGKNLVANTDRVLLLTPNQQCQSTEGTQFREMSRSFQGKISSLIQTGCSSWRPTNNVKALKARSSEKCQGVSREKSRQGKPLIQYYFYYFTNAAVAVDSSHMTASSSASWSRFRPPSNFVNGHVSTMWKVIGRDPICAS